MRRAFFIVAATLLATPMAWAQSAPSDAETVSCPRGRVSIYYSSGDAAPSPEAETLIRRVSDNASLCQPDGIDLVTRIDPRVDGEKAIELALQRLSDVAENLVANGFPSDRIRVAAQAANEFALPGLGEVEVIFRKSPASKDDVAAPPPRPVQGSAESI